MSFLNVICLLNVLYILVKYHENGILTCFKVMGRTKFLQFRRQGDITHGPSQLELSFLYPTPYQMPSTTWKSSWKQLKEYFGVMGCTIMHLYGWMDSMLIAISPKPINRRITKFNKRAWWYSYINLDANFFYFYMKFLSLWPWPQGHTLDGDHAE